MELRDLVEDYVVSLELGEHKKVSELSTKICVRLIEILDDYLVERQDDYDDNDDDGSELNNCDTQLVHVVGSICDRIRKYDDIAVANHEVRSFVHLYDMVCLSRMVGAISYNKAEAARQPEHELPNDVEFLAYIMRSACFLLRYMNEHLSTVDWPMVSSEPQAWIDTREQIKRINSIGFPIYTLDIHSTNSSSNLRPRSNSDGSFVDHFKTICASAVEDEYFVKSELSQILASKWFQQFLGITLSQNYPLDRFNSLIALWIVADICECNSMENLMSELVDQIYHEESNSCNVDELLQMGTQVGSYWLSYHRRHQVTFASATSIEVDEDQGDDQDEDDGDELSQRSAESEDLSNFEAKSGTGNSRAKLRQLMKDELLEGPICLMCGSRPREPLTCLQQQYSCSKCHHSETPKVGDFCALSRRALPLVRLDTLKQQLRGEKSLVLVSQNEWLRQGLAISSNRIARLPTARAFTEQTSERVDIKANFERLTIIRDTSEPQEDEEYGSLADDADSEDDDEVNTMKSTLRAYMSSAESRQDLSASESIKMLRFVRNDPSQPNGISLCSNDFLILDQQDGLKQVDFRLVASDSLIALTGGSLWICGSRSSVSKLRRGCGRLFGSLELLRHPKTTAPLDGFVCCFCHLGLRKLTPFPGDLQWTLATQ